VEWAAVGHKADIETGNPDSSKAMARPSMITAGRRHCCGGSSESALVSMASAWRTGQTSPNFALFLRKWLI
jgi:hypothetical protein